MAPMKSVCSERVPFGISTHQINNVNGKPQTRKIGLGWKYVSSILFDKVAEFNGELYFSNDGDIAKKLGAMVDPGRRKALKCTITPDIQRICTNSMPGGKPINV